MTNLNLPIYITGDNHGEYDALLRKIDHLGIGNCYLIHVGDGGVGFKSPDKQKREFDLLNNRFKKRNILFKGIRGNHDDPSYFLGQYNFSHFELLPDYSYRQFNGDKFLFVGGAVSIDRRIRVPNMSWWKDEIFVLKPELVKKADVLITHSCPLWIGEWTKQGIHSWCEKDHTLWNDCMKERENITKLIDLAQPKNHYCGHMHTSLTAFNQGCKSMLLDILEIVEHR